MSETRAEKFVRLSQSRLAKALSAIALIGNLGGKDYEHTPDQAQCISTALREAVARVEVALGLPDLATPTPPPAPEFEVSDAESLALIVSGSLIDQAINEIADGNPQAARALLLRVMAL